MVQTLDPSGFRPFVGSGRLGSGRWSFHGAEGLKQLSTQRFVFTAPHPERFRAVTTRIAFSDAMVESFRVTPHTMRRKVRDDVRASRPIDLTYLVEGRLCADHDGRWTAVDAGQLALSRASPATVRADVETHSIHVSVNGSRFPPGALQRDAIPNGPLPHTALTSSFVAFVRRLTDAGVEPTAVQGDFLALALADLAVAVVVEAIGPDSDDDGERLRFLIAEHIDRNLHDPALSPQTLAAALGSSVRTVHRVFNRDGTTVSRSIRERRLDAVARALRGDGAVRLSSLSDRFGFSGRDQLGRAFLNRFGVTMSTYRDDPDRLGTTPSP